MPPQPDSNREPEPRNDQPGGIGSEARISLNSAKAAIEQDAGRSGKEYWAAFEYDSEKRREIDSLRRWADAAGAWLQEPQTGAWEGGPGMGEHDIKEIGDSMWKATKGGKFGIYLNCTGRAMADPVRQIQKVSGTPHQYLNRLVLLNEWCRELDDLAGLPELTRLEGVATLDGEFSIITSQPCFPHDASQPSADEVCEWLLSLGFRMVTAGIYYRQSDNLGLFDVKPANAIRSGGSIVPIDIIPIRPQDVMKSVIDDVLGIR